MFKRVAKATSKRDDAEDYKLATGDDTAIGIDRLVDESSSSEGEDSDGEDDDSSDDEDAKEEESEEAGEQGSDGEGKDDSKAGSKRKRGKDEPEAEEEVAAAQVSIDDAIQDPIYVPTEGERSTASLHRAALSARPQSSRHLTSSPLIWKARATSDEWSVFQRYVQDQLSESQRKGLDARDAVDNMDAWKAEQDELEKQKLAAAPLSKKALAKKEKAAEFRKKKKEQALKKKRRRKPKARRGSDCGQEGRKAEKGDKKEADVKQRAKVLQRMATVPPRRRKPSQRTSKLLLGRPTHLRKGPRLLQRRLARLPRTTKRLQRSPRLPPKRQRLLRRKQRPRLKGSASIFTA